MRHYIKQNQQFVTQSEMPHAEDKLRQMFNMGCTHPDEDDLKKASDFAKRIQKQIENDW